MCIRDRGSGGIVSTVADRVGCCWKTADTHIQRTPKLKALFEAECETAVDEAESIILNNILAARRLQEEAAAAGVDLIVDSSDARWLLARKGKDRGWGDGLAVLLRTAPGRIEIVTLREKMVALGVSDEFLPEL